MKAVVLGMCLLTSASAFAAWIGTPAVPTAIDLIRADGFVISGAFGNPNNCTHGGSLFVKADHPQYKQLYAAALAAMLNKQKISGYVHTCEPIVWYSPETTTYNVIGPNGSLSIIN